MRLQRYILAELLAAFALIALIITGVLFAAMMLRFLHQLPDLGLLSVLQAAPYIAPAAFPITLPLSFLVACLLTYGRFSDDNEFLALQMGGIHPWHAAAPAMASATVPPPAPPPLPPPDAPSDPAAAVSVAPAPIRQRTPARPRPVESHVQSTVAVEPVPVASGAPAASVIVTVHGSAFDSRARKRTGPPRAPVSRGS